jgi:hypothetical protein
MWQAVQKANPKIIKKMQEMKYELPVKVKDQRYILAQQLEYITDCQLLSTIYLDEMVFWARLEESVPVICLRGVPLLPLHDPRLNRTHAGESFRKEIKVHALYAVNAEVGLVGWWPLSGTTDWTPNYKVWSYMPCTCIVVLFGCNPRAVRVDNHNLCTTQCALLGSFTYLLDNDLKVWLLSLALRHSVMAMLIRTSPLMTSSS